MRMFVLDRIKILNLTDERFTLPKGFNLDDFMCHSFKVMHDELYTAKVRISPGWARWVQRRFGTKARRSRRMGMAAWISLFRLLAWMR